MYTEDLVCKNVSNNIQHMLSERGWDITKLVNLSKVPRNTVYRIARGDNVPSSVHLKNIADALGVSVDWLLTNSQKMRTSA